MAAAPQNMSKTLIIPPGSAEHFIAFPHHPAGHGWFDNGIALAGISALTPGYRVHHASARYHFAGYCTGGEAHYAGGRQAGTVTAGQFLFLPAGQLQHLDSDQAFQMIWQLIEPQHPRWRFLAAKTAAIHRDWRCGREIATLAEWLQAESQSTARSGPATTRPSRFPRASARRWASPRAISAVTAGAGRPDLAWPFN